MKSLDASVIAIPKTKLSLFPPRAFGFRRTRESLNGKTGVSFDALSAPETAADMTLGFLLHPERASRLIQQKALESNNLGLSEVLDRIMELTILKKEKDSYLNEVQTNINFRVLFHLMNLAADQKVHPQVTAIAYQKLRNLKSSLLAGGKSATSAEMVRRINRFMEEPEDFKVIPTPNIPDGSPIGMDCVL